MANLQEALIKAKLSDEKTIQEVNRVKQQNGGNSGPRGLAIPEDYVAEAERVMQNLGQSGRDSEKLSFKLTTSQLRGILANVSDIYNVENLRKEETLLQESIDKLKLLHVKIVYQAGKEEDKVKPFVKESKILEYLKGIGSSREQFIRFSRYMEALTAYHRFLGGKE